MGCARVVVRQATRDRGVEGAPCTFDLLRGCRWGLGLKGVGLGVVPPDGRAAETSSLDKMADEEFDIF